MAAIDPPTADMAEDDPSAPRSTRFDWDKIATEEAAKLEREEREEAEAEKRSSKISVDASARDPPRSAAEAEERRKRDALREAKDTWRAKDAADLAAKHIVGEGLVATQVSITSADLGKDKNAVHIKGARDCVFTIDPNVRCAKLFIEDCTRCEVKVDGVIVTQSAEVWNCVDCSMAVMTQLCTIQVDGCAGQRLRFNKTEFFGAVVHATCTDKLLLQFEHIVSQLCLVEAEDGANERHLASVSADPNGSKGSGEIAQFITRVVNGAILTERVVRGKDEFPTTAREMLVARNEAALAGDLSAKASIETSGDSKINADTTADRAETRKDKGNEAFKEGNYPQAAVFYTQCLELVPAHHVALANRAACFLKMGEHGKALDDSIKCAEVAPEYVKGHFRKGLSLHALGRYGEAGCSLEIAERLDPRNKQVVEALKMAAFKARQQPRD